MVGHAFVPGSKIRFNTRWRNIPRYELKLFKLDLGSNLHLDEGGHHPSEWIKTLKTRELESVYPKYSRPEIKGDHERGSQEIVLERNTSRRSLPGGWLVDGEEQSREFVLISRLTVMARASSNRMLVWVCDSVDGHPLPGAEVRLMAACKIWKAMALE
jgi:hypothetical protein